MNNLKTSPFYRPIVAGLGFFAFFYVFLIAKGRDAGAAKIMIVGGWLLSGVVVVAFTQAIRKKDFGWVGATIGVVGVAMVVAVIMNLLKSGQPLLR